MKDEEILDSPEALAHLDPAGMIGLAAALPDQIEQALLACQSVPLQRQYQYGQYDAILGLGTGGGSHFALAVVAALMEDMGRVPFVLRQGSTIPAWVGPETLVLAVSYSGNTRETIASFRAALARRARVVAFSTGGTLRQEAAAARVPAVRLLGVSDMPRASLASILVPLLNLLYQLDQIDDQAQMLRQAANALRARMDPLLPSTPTVQNPAKRLAKVLLQGRPLLIASAETALGAERFALQLSENAKTWAAIEQIPHLHHDKIVGLTGPQGLEGVVVMLLRSQEESDETRRRFEATASLLQGVPGSHVIELRSSGASRWEEWLYQFLFVDLTTCYLAALHGVDPCSVRVIDQLKRSLGPTT